MRPLTGCVAGIVLVAFLVLPVTADPPRATVVLSPYPPPSGGIEFRCYGGSDWGQFLPPRRPHLIGSSCTMVQRPLYDPSLPGSYYFRPYHHSHVRIHQMYGAQWGEHPATPYANQLFQRVYQEYRQSEGL